MDIATLQRTISRPRGLGATSSLGAASNSALMAALDAQERYRQFSSPFGRGLKDIFEIERTYRRAIEESRVLEQVRAYEAVFRESSAMRAAEQLQQQMKAFRSNELLGVSALAAQHLTIQNLGLTNELTRLDQMLLSQTEAMRQISRLAVPLHLNVMDYLGTSGLVDAQSLAALHAAQRYAALSRVSTAALDAFSAPGSVLGALPLSILSAPVVAPYLGAMTTDILIADCIDEEQTVEWSSHFAPTVHSAIGATTEEIEQLLATCDPRLPGLVLAARVALRAREVDYVAHVSISLRRAVDVALDRIAPRSAVATWVDPRRKMRTDGKGPTMMSRVEFAFRSVDGGKPIGRIALAQIIVVEGLLHELNSRIHGDSHDGDPLLLELVVHQVECLLLWLAYAAKNN